MAAAGLAGVAVTDAGLEALVAAGLAGLAVTGAGLAATVATGLAVAKELQCSGGGLAAYCSTPWQEQTDHPGIFC